MCTEHEIKVREDKPKKKGLYLDIVLCNLKFFFLCTVYLLKLLEIW